LAELRTFLTAEWRDLALLNWRVQRESLEPHVPAGTELDSWNGAFYVSLVGFRFLNTQVLGVPVPFHSSFEYSVSHPSWRICQVADARAYGSVDGSPGELWSTVFGSSPHSAFFADGSPVTVSTPARVERRC
jgi:uncharacterized protein YqjF (DUF2071 family)